MPDPSPIPPPVGSGDSPELYKLSGIPFQKFCRDILDRGADSEIQSCREYGIPGERQEGIDLIAERFDGAIDVFQCKCVRNFEPADIRSASAEFLKYLEFWQTRRIRRFVVLVGSDLNHRKRQEEILKQIKTFRDKYDLRYELWPQSRIINKLRAYPGIVRQYFHPAWVDNICDQPGGATLHLELARQNALTGHLLSALGSASNEKLDTLREKWRQGRRKEVKEILRGVKADQISWLALAPDIQASFLRFEASVTLETDGDIVQAETLLARASALHISREDVRVQAAIRLHRGDAEGALGLLQVAETDQLRHFKAFLLVEMRRPAEAESILGEIAAETAETLQLRSLCSFARRRFGDARLALQKALERAPEWISLQHLSAVIDYFSAVAPALVPTFIPAWPEPVPAIYVLQDDESRQSLRRAAIQFQRLLEHAELNEAQRSCVETWKIASLAADPDRRGEFEEQVKHELEAKPTHHRAFAWATVARMKLTIEGPALAIRQLIGTCQRL
jgi:hypothetical protein